MADPVTAWSTWGIVSLVAGSSFGAAILTQGTTWLRDWHRDARDRAFSKLYLVAALESYANDAAIAISDSENYDSSDGQIGKALANVPALPSYPEEVEWKLLGTSTTKDMLGFPIEIDRLRAMISFHWDVGLDPEDTVPIVRESTAMAALRALQLAAQLEDSYTEDDIQLDDGSWNAKSALQESYDLYQARRLAFEKAQREAEDAMDEFGAGPAIP